MKKPLTVFLGAGASVSLGVPSTAAITTAVLAAMQAAETQHRSTFGLPPPPLLPDPVAQLWACLGAHYSGQANFEHVLHSLEAASSLLRSWEPTTANRHKIVEAALAGGVHPSLVTVFDRLFLIRSRTALFAEIHRLVDAACDSIPSTSNWAAVRSFYTRLDTEFDLRIVTTNYDTVVEQALGWGATEQGFTPVSGENVSRFTGHAAATRLAKMHGSIHFGYRASTNPGRFRFEDDFDDLCWHAAPASALASWGGRSSPSSGAGREMAIGPLITGLQKPDKLLVEPYASYYRSFGAALAPVPRLLVIGYGFSDPHVNSILRRMTAWHGANRRIAFVTWYDPNNWSPASAWALEHGDNLRTIAYWSEQSDPLDVLNYPDPWVPSGSGAPCVRGFLRGFPLTVAHENALVGFLQS